MNNEPRYGCWVIITFCDSASPVVEISSSPNLDIQILYSVEGDTTTNAYSEPPSKYIGESKVNLVATDASVDVVISEGKSSFLLNGITVVVGVPNSHVLSSTLHGNSSSFVEKYKSTEVMNTPFGSPTSNDCARGSYHVVRTFCVKVSVLSAITDTSVL